MPLNPGMCCVHPPALSRLRRAQLTLHTSLGFLNKERDSNQKVRAASASEGALSPRDGQSAEPAGSPRRSTELLGAGGLHPKQIALRVT